MAMLNNQMVNLGSWWDYPLVVSYIAIENGPVEIVDLPINSMVDLSIAM